MFDLSPIALSPMRLPAAPGGGGRLYVVAGQAESPTIGHVKPGAMVYKLADMVCY